MQSMYSSNETSRRYPTALSMPHLASACSRSRILYKLSLEDGARERQPDIRIVDGTRGDHRYLDGRARAHGDFGSKGHSRDEAGRQLMNAPKTSIVITNYNYGRFVARCIDSALAQSYPDTEVVVVDDASRDQSREIIQSYGTRVLPVLQQRNAGQGAAFNVGFRACHGDVVLFLDADDWLYPHAVARVVTALSPGVAQVQFRLHLVDNGGRQIDVLPPPEVRFDEGDVVPILLSRGRYEGTVTSGNAFVRTTLSSILPVPEEAFRISADGYLVTVAPFCGRVVSIDEPLGAYVLHGTNYWAGSVGYVAESEKFRRALRHDSDRYEALRRKAAEYGLAVALNPGLADPQHLTNRIGSLVMDPQNHPDPRDSRLALAIRGAWACSKARLSVARRALLAMWFLAVGVLPQPWAAKLISWRLDPVSRPERLGRAMATVRRWTL
jgi:glycosyltransferase involved in cell wall biosynthesis